MLLHPACRAWWRRCPLALLLALGLAANLRAQISYTGAGYVQNFNTLEGTANNTADLPWSNNETLPGWYATRSTYSVTGGTLGGSAGAFDDTAVALNHGLFSFGAIAATDRALGSRAAGGAPVRFGVRLVNATGQPITRFSVAFHGEQWFKSSTTGAQSLTVDYQLGATGLDDGGWTAITALGFAGPVAAGVTATALNGNAAANRLARVATIANVVWAPGQELWIRFSDADDNGQDHGLAIDDFALWTGEGGALFLNGTNHYVTMGVAPALGLDVFTLECWFLRIGAGLTTSTGTGGVTGVPLVTKGRGEADGSNADCNYFFGLDAAGRLIADFEAAPAAGLTAGQNFPITGNTAAPIGRWNHAAVTYDGGTWRLYLNGELDATSSTPPGAVPRFDSGQHFGIGTAMTSTGAAAGFFHGAIDEVRVWSVARSSDDIRLTRDLPVASDAPGLVARYALEEGAGTSAAGLVAGAPAGTLTGGPAWTVGRRLVPNLAPTVALTSPTAAYRGMFPATVPLAAAAADADGAILRVEFFAGSTRIAELTQPPYAFEWRNVAAGTHTLTSVATDNAGATTTSAPVTIDVLPNPNRPPALALDRPAAGATGIGAMATLAVTLADPENAALRVIFHGRKTTPATPGPDFVIGTLPDTAAYSENRPNRAATFLAQTRWYLENRDRLQLAFISHLGDFVEHGDLDGATSNLAEWLVADAALRTLENPALSLRPFGIPWGGAPGDRDQSPQGDAGGTTRLFNQFFGASRFAGRAYYGGHYGTNNNNNYQLFSASGLDFIVIHLEHDARARGLLQPVLDWADALLKAHPHRRAIVTTHWLLNPGSPGAFSAQGHAIYERLRSNPNLFLLLGGHIAGEGRRVDRFQGRAVHSILQSYHGRANGGDGWLRYYVLSPARNTITAKTFSPVLDRSETDAGSEFVLPCDLQAPVGDWIPLGTVSVAAGATAARFEWTGLEPGAHYEWYAEVRDEINTTTAPPRRFVTAPAAPPAVELTAPAAAARFELPPSLRLAASVRAGPDSRIARVEFYHGETRIGQATAAPYEITWARPLSGEYLLSAVAVDHNGHATLSRVVPITITNPRNRPPTAALASPAGETRTLAPAAVRLVAEAADADGAVAKVEFFAGAVKLGERTLPPFAFTWTDVPPGDYPLTARVIDNDGATTTSAPVALAVLSPVIAPLIPRHATWKYLDDGSNQGTAWRARDFDDSSWPSGAAELGYGDGDETTIVGFGPNPARRAITTYFRRRFEVADPARVGQLVLDILRDDGAIVYLNGTEIGRSGMTAGVNYLFNTLAPAATEGADERTFFPLPFSVDPAPLLVRGANVLAVEVHQQAIANSDLSFDLELLERRLPVRTPPTVALTSPAPGGAFDTPGEIVLTASAADRDGAVVKVEFQSERGRIGEATRPPYALTWSDPPPGQHLLTAVATDDDGNFIASAPVPVVVRELDPGRFVNFSIRARAGTGAGTLIVGFVTGGAGTAGAKPLLLRAVGPTLASFGIPNVVTDPVVRLYSGTAVVATNDNWAGDAQVAAVGAQVGAFPLGDPGSRDAALVATRAPGPHALQIAPAGPAGEVLAEIYDATPAAGFTATTPRLINVSARGLVGAGNDTLIAGFVLRGRTERTVLVRAIGPALSAFALTGALADPKLQLFRAGEEAPIASNEDWGGGPVLATAFARVAAFNLPAASRDAALLIRLAPGTYTVRAYGPPGAGGVILIDLYEVP